MPEDHVGVLQALLGLGDGDAIPEALEASYWGLKRVFDRVQCYVTPRDMAWLVIQHQGTAELPSEVETVSSMWRKHKIGPGARCEAMFKGEWTPGVILASGSKNEFKVLLDGGVDERSFNAAKIRLVELANV